MAHTGLSTSFAETFRETLLAFFFNILGLLAGFIVASQLGIFRLSPWAIAMFPAVLGAKSVIEGLLSGRLSTGLHLGIIHPRFLSNTKSYYKLLEALIVVTLVASVAMSAVSLLFGNLLWGMKLADFPALLTVVIATMAFGLSLFLVTSKVAFFSFKRGLDPDIVVYPVMSNVSSILITFFYVVALNLRFSTNSIGPWLIIGLGLFHLLLVLYILPKNLHEPEFIKTLRESLITMTLVVFIVIVTGTILKGINNFTGDRKSIYIYTVYPALIGLTSAVGSVVGSTATTKLALGLLKPTLSSMYHHAKNILSAWLASIIMFILVAVAALSIHGLLSLTLFLHLVSIMMIANAIAVGSIILISYAISILTFKRGLNPSNFVIPLETSLAGIMISVALFVALVALR
jgi:mgtE-like transporter